MASLIVDSFGYEAVSTVLGGIGLGGGFGLVLAASIALRAPLEMLRRYSRIAMVIAILFLAMLMIRRYRMDRQLRDQEIEVVPV